jgi:hypothetical protein
MNRKDKLKKKIGTKFGILTPQGIQKQMIIDMKEMKKVSCDPLAYAYGLFKAKSGQKMGKKKGLAPEYIKGFEAGKKLI